VVPTSDGRDQHRLLRRRRRGDAVAGNLVVETSSAVVAAAAVAGPRRAIPEAVNAVPVRARHVHRGRRSVGDRPSCP